MSNIEARFKGKLGAFSFDVSFTSPGRGVTGLFGPSGCGKTTILRCLAGLTRFDDGYLAVDGEIWQDGKRFLEPHKRPVGYVFQEARLFPHLSVLGNLQYGSRRVSLDRRAIDLDSIVELMGVRNLLKRMPARLSGGERQRVAVGRALLAQPRLLLMDEPLSALDDQSKAEILPYLEGLPAALSIPIVYVSHDIVEIERMADHLVLLDKGGGVRACGPLSRLQTDLTLPLARKPESATVISVTVGSYDEAYDLTTCLIDDMPVLVPGRFGPTGSRKRFRVRASDVSLVKVKPHATSVLNILPARVLSAEQASANQMLVLLGLGEEQGEARLLSSITRKSWDGLELRPGEGVFVQIKGMASTDMR